MGWTVYNSDGQILQGSATLANDSVDSQHYVAASIDNEHLADDAVDSAEIAAGAIDLAHMSANSVDSTQYVDGSIDLAHMSVNSIDSDQYVDGSIDLAHMSVNSIDSDQYVDGSIDSAHIANDQIDSQHYAAGSVDLEHMASESVDEDNLYISNAGNNGEFLSKQSGNNGGLTWAAAGGGKGTIQVHPQSYSGTYRVESQGDLPITALGSASADGTIGYSFQLPSDATSISECFVVYMNMGNSLAIGISCTTDFGQINESRTANSDSIAAAFVAKGINTFAEYDITAALTGATAGDHVGIQVTREGVDGSDLAGDVGFAHLVLEYNK